MRSIKIFIAITMLFSILCCNIPIDDDSSGNGKSSKKKSSRDTTTTTSETSSIVNVEDQGNGKNIDYNSLIRYGIEADSVEGTWYQEDNSIYTYDSVIVSFNFPNLEPGKYQIILTGKSWTPRTTQSELNAGFENYIINVSTDYDLSDNIEIPASITEWQDGSIIFDLTGPTIIFIQWMNPEIGVNFQLLKIELVIIEDNSSLENDSTGEGNGS